MAASKTAPINQTLVEFHKANRLKLTLLADLVTGDHMRREHPVAFLNPAKFLLVQFQAMTIKRIFLRDFQALIDGLHGTHFGRVRRKLAKKEVYMKARDVMNTRVTAATPRAIGRDLALQLLSGMYSGLPVVNSKGKVIGVVTEFDLLQAIHEGKDLQSTKAEEIMTKPAVCAQEDEEIDSVIAKMTEKNIIRLPIVREDGTLTGVIARSDILSSMIETEFVTVMGA